MVFFFFFNSITITMYHSLSLHDALPILEAKSSGFEMNNEAARLLYAGIVGDTGRFLYPSTTAKTFQYASELVTYHFDRSALYEGLYDVKENIARLRGHVLKHFEQSPNGLSTIKLTKDVLEK